MKCLDYEECVHVEDSTPSLDSLTLSWTNGTIASLAIAKKRFTRTTKVRNPDLEEAIAVGARGALKTF
jgi:hypothetical protein